MPAGPGSSVEFAHATDPHLDARITGCLISAQLQTEGLSIQICL